MPVIGQAIVACQNLALKGQAMKLEDKVKEIVEAVKCGIAKRRIDVKYKGKYLNKMLKGEEVAEETIQQMHKNLLEYRKNPQKITRRLEAYKDVYSEIPIALKIAKIKEAADSGIPKVRLDPHSEGKTVTRVQREQPVSLAKINEIYSNIISFEQVKASVPLKGENKIEENKSQIEYLAKKVAELECKIACLEKSHRARKAEKVLGLTVLQKKDIVSGKGYLRWYAIYRESGKKRWIYIGVDKSKAKTKILSWLNKNNKEVRNV